jgi:hypothetical protein
MSINSVGSDIELLTAQKRHLFFGVILSLDSKKPAE